MTIGRTEFLRLYRSSLRAAQQFETYNFRKYFYRRTRDRFRTASTLGDAQMVEKAVLEAQEELKVMQRQGVVNRMFSHKHTALEADPQYAGRARRFGAIAKKEKALEAIGGQGPTDSTVTMAMAQRM
ncbi:LYR motif-containing protein 4 [Coemansia sp. Benny D160-2]|nr:LYR motif-containing protein 4 [Coemansia sp. Benny D160-2]